MPGPTVRMATLWLICLWLVACTRPTSSTSVPPLTTPSPAQVEVPVTVEVTRVVTHPVVVESTPVAAMPCVPTSLEAASTITVGVVLPLSLPGSMVAGFAMQTAVSLAVQDINNQGGIAGRPLTFVTYDSAGQEERGRTSAERLILNDCVAGIIGTYHSHVARAAGDVAHRYNVPLLIAQATMDDITASEYPEIFRISPARTSLDEMPVHWLNEVGDYNKDGQLVAGIISASNQTHYVEGVLSAFESTSVEAHHFSVDLPAADFSPVVARIVTMDHVPDALFVYLKGDDALALTSQILAAGIGPQKSTLIVLEYAGLESDHFWQTVPDGVGIVVARLGPWHSTVTPMGQDFAIDYGHYAGHWPEGYAFAAYDAVYLMADAILRAGSLQGTALVAALEDTDIELTSGHYTFPYGSQNPPSADGAAAYLWHQWPETQALYLQYTEPLQPAHQMPVIWPPQYRTVETAIVR